MGEEDQSGSAGERRRRTYGMSLLDLMLTTGGKKKEGEEQRQNAMGEGAPRSIAGDEMVRIPMAIGVRGQASPMAHGR
jgi:hypothetical protein